jgi:hypothetical protein
MAALMHVYEDNGFNNLNEVITCLFERSSYALTWLSLTQPLEVLQKKDLTIKEVLGRFFCKRLKNVSSKRCKSYTFSPANFKA